MRISIIVALLIIFSTCFSLVGVWETNASSGLTGDRILGNPVFGNKSINTTATDYDTGTDSVEIGDIDPNYPGNELIFSGYGWGVAYAYWDGIEWHSKLLWNRSYEMLYTPALAVGDLDPDYPGLEVVDGLDQVFVIHYDNTTQNWSGTLIWDPWQESGGTQSIEDLKIGDFDLRHPGNELLCVTNGWVREFYKDPNGTWMNETIADNLPRIYKCDVGDFDPRFDGNECAIFTENKIAEYAWNGSGWYNEWISTSPYGDWGDVTSGRVADVLSENNVSEIVCVDRGPGVLVIVCWNNTSYEKKDAWYYPASGWPTVTAVGDCWGAHEGNEIIVGDAKTCYLVWEENGQWRGQAIFTDGWLGEKIEIGEFDYSHPGLEIACPAYGLYELYEEPTVSESSNAFMLFVFPFIAVPVALWRLRRGVCSCAA